MNSLIPKLGNPYSQFPKYWEATNHSFNIERIVIESNRAMFDFERDFLKGVKMK
jgi:hypothetical protein